jgi:DNA polymerase-3 subunit delta'
VARAGAALRHARRRGAPCDACQACRFALAGTHPDLHWLYPRPRLKDGDASAADVRADLGEATAERLGEQHGLWGAPAGSEGLYVATMRAVVQQAQVSPAIGRQKVFVVGDASAWCRRRAPMRRRTPSSSCSRSRPRTRR